METLVRISALSLWPLCYIQMFHPVQVLLLQVLPTDATLEREWCSESISIAWGSNDHDTLYQQLLVKFPRWRCDMLMGSWGMVPQALKEWQSTPEHIICNLGIISKGNVLIIFVFNEKQSQGAIILSEVDVWIECLTPYPTFLLKVTS